MILEECAKNNKITSELALFSSVMNGLAVSASISTSLGPFCPTIDKNLGSFFVSPQGGRNVEKSWWAQVKPIYVISLIKDNYIALDIGQCA